MDLPKFEDSQGLIGVGSGAYPMGAPMIGPGGRTIVRGAKRDDYLQE